MGNNTGTLRSRFGFEPRFSFHQIPHLPSSATRSRDVSLSQLGVPLCHHNIGMSEDFGELIKIPAVHHVPGGERVAQIVETEVLDSSHGQDSRSGSRTTAQ